MNRNRSSTIKRRGTRGYRFARRVERITDRFHGKTQDVRGQLILDLQQLEEVAWREATRTGQERKKTAEHRKWAKLAAYVSQVVNGITKTYDFAKIRSQLDELLERVKRIERDVDKKGTPRD